MSDSTVDTLSPVKRALQEVRDMRARLHRLEQARQEPIAIVGMGCRVPGADSPDAFWQLLCDGVDAITELPPDRWNLDQLFDPDPDAPGKIYVRHGGFLRDIDKFDARFFGITPREAESMDPQQRLLLEVSWEALEHAGIAPDGLMGRKAGVFLGISTSDYMQQQLRATPVEAIDAYLATGGCLSVAAGRISYFLGAQGPAVAVDTACSSSLVAVHLACQSLRNGESELALAAGVSLMLVPEIVVNFCRAHMLAPDGRCKTFDASANGYVRSEGCGVVVLKRLSDAQAAGDRVLAVIRGSAMNQDGRSSGLTVPNGPAQEAVIRDAVAAAGLSPADVQYVEAHGTGTSLGDPIELRALGRALGEGRTAPLLVGSAKTNVGHLEAAAGITGLIKLAMAIHHGEIPPHLHFREPNPHVEWKALPVEVVAAGRKWDSGAARRTGGVSSFGFSGTNAHVIVQQTPDAAPASAGASAADRATHVLSISAKSEKALLSMAARYADRIERSTDAFADICYSAATGRTHHEYRLAVAAATRGDAVTALRSVTSGPAVPAAVRGRAAQTPAIGFIFTGQGSQYAGMGRRLYETEPRFRQALDAAAAIVRNEIGESILPVIFDGGAKLDETAYTQPAIFSLEYALFELYRAWGVHPSFVLGHSLGEDVAACVAGVFSLEDALRMVCARARLMQALPREGAMAAVFASEAAVGAVIAELGLAHAVGFAAINGPESVALSGTRAALDAAVAELSARGIKSRPMTASHACHSAMMDPVLAPLREITRTIAYAEPAIDFVSSVTGTLLTSEVTDPEYWVRHVRQPVRFSDAIATLRARGCSTFVEIGPSPVLIGLARRFVGERDATWLASLRKGRDDWQEIAGTVATLYAQGVPIDWRAWDAPFTRNRVGLPTYAFQRERHWALDTAGARRPATSDVPAEACWQAATLAAGDQASRVPLDLAVATYPDKWSALESLTIAYMTAALRRLGAFATAGARTTVDRLIDEYEILEEYRVLMTRWLHALSGAGLLQQEDDEFVAAAALPEADLESALARARTAFGSDDALLRYVEHCGGMVADVLTGRESPLETLFPGGSTELAAGLYEASPVARYINGIARGAAASLALAAGGPAQFLEIGAGTGGTTAALLPALAASGAHYTFTDLGPLFLSKARERFAQYGFVDYRQMDIERAPEEQGLAPRSVDVVVAANVLHATRNLHRTVDHALALLRGGGVLVLLETTRHPIWFDVSTGLIHGWQIFDDELRGDHPLITAEQWSNLLHAHGAEAVEIYPKPGSPADVIGQHVILARVAASVGSSGTSARSSVAAASGDAGRTKTAPTTLDLRSQLAAAADDEVDDVLESFVRGVVGKILRLDAETIDADSRLMDLGVDSLMAVELRNLLAAGLGSGRRLPATLIFDYPTPRAIARYLRAQIKPAVEPAVRQETVAVAEHTHAAEVAAMSEAEVEALLNKSLERL